MISLNVSKKITLIIISILLPLACFSQTFTEQKGILLSSVSNSSVAWGDYNNDGYLDILLTGYNGSINISKVYRNNGDNTFTEQTGISLSGFGRGSVAWGDYDNDGNLDILFTGETNNGGTKIYRNNGDDTFTEQTSISLTSDIDASIACGDYDNDGYLDIITTGTSTPKIYHNNGNNAFTFQSGISLPKLQWGSVAWGDYDNDGDLDILITGFYYPTGVSKIYRNEGNNTFTEQTGISLIGVMHGSVAWGDYDNDGDLDILLTGRNGWPVSSPGVSKIYRNNGNNTFTEQTGISLTGVKNSSVAWGDYDNDGDLDILLTGDDGLTIISKIYRNNGNNTFTEQTNFSLAGGRTICWGDYDNDGDLDILLSGSGPTKIYRNDGTAANKIPDAPTGIEQSVSGNDAILKWKHVTTDITPAKALSYNVRVGTTSNAINTISPQASDNGLRRIPAMGNGQLDTVFYLKNLKKGTYYWSVQAIDNSYRGGSFSTEGSFVVTANKPACGLTVSNFEGSCAMLNWNRGNLDKCIVFIKEGTGSFSPVNNTTYTASSIFGQGANGGNGWYCVYNGVGDNVKITGLKGLTNYTVQVFEYDGTAGTEQYLSTNLTDNIKSFTTLLFTKQTGSSFFSETIDLGDYDNDGNLDILVTIIVPGGSIPDRGMTKIYRNNGDNTFTEQTGISLVGVYSGSAKWGDYNNDGYLDIIESGVVNGSKSYMSAKYTTLIYKNNGNGTFTEQTDIKLPALADSYVAWGEYNNDGFLDFLLTGSGISKIYKNNGDNTFTEQTGISLTGVREGSVAWGDYDNDGFLDILICGSGISKIYRNNGNNTFTEQTGISLTGVTSASAAWGDYNNDNYLDILLNGYNGSTYISKIYKNNGDNTFTEQTGISLTFGNMNSAAWGDYNNDGNLDLLISGYNGSTYISRIYRNNGDNTFSEETGISLTVVGNGPVVWGDFDNDGDLDILSNSNYFRNDIGVVKAIPNNAPINLDHTITDKSVKLTWHPSASIPNQGKGYSYNVRVFKKSDSLNVVSSHSAANGIRTIVATGNAQLNNSFTLNNLQSGTYYWQVQAIDGAYQGGAFSIIDSFVVDISNQSSGLKILNIDDTSALLKWQRGNLNKCAVFITEGLDDLLIINNTTYTASSVYKNGSKTTNGWYCVYNGIGESVQISGLKGNSSYTVEVIEYNGAAGSENYLSTSSFQNFKAFKTQHFSLQSGFPSFNPSNTSHAWGDYDNDGDLDILITGFYNYDYYSKIFRNNGDKTFTEQTGISLTGIASGSVAWGDYDNDGYLDILLTGGYYPGITTSKIYRNNGNNTFTEQTGISLTGVVFGSVVWGDYNNDGNLDILLTGDTEFGDKSNPTAISKLYRNNGDNTFTEQTGISLVGISGGAAAWGDYNNDGNLDILLTGSVSTKIYRNNGDNTFTEQKDILINVNGISTTWGDYDNDGYLDIVIAGAGVTKIYRNNGNNTFTEQTGISLAGITNGCVIWGDQDNDGYLDILVTGSGFTKIYRNNGDNTFSEETTLKGSTYGYASWCDYDIDGDLDIALPFNLYNNTIDEEAIPNNTPINLDHIITDKSVKLTWHPSASIPNQGKGYSYNVRIFKKSDSSIIAPSHSAENGFRKVVTMGNAQLNNSLTINNLKLGTYYWQVQSVDNHFQGGAWSDIDTLEMRYSYESEMPEIFPNPVHDVINILNKNINMTPQLYIYTTNGILLYNNTLTCVLTKIDVSNYYNGIYIFKILDSDGFKTYKIIKNSP